MGASSSSAIFFGGGGGGKCGIHFGFGGLGGWCWIRKILGRLACCGDCGGNL